MVDTMTRKKKVIATYSWLFNEFTYYLKLFQQREAKIFQFLEKCPPFESETTSMYNIDPKVDTKTCIFIQTIDMAKKSFLHFRIELLRSSNMPNYSISTSSSIDEVYPIIRKERELIKQLDYLSTILSKISGSTETWNMRKKEIKDNGIEIEEIAKRYDKYVELRNYICHTFKPQDDSRRSEIPEIKQIREDLLSILQYVIKPFIDCYFPEVL